MHNPKISIIVPIYKAESTLIRCLDSLKAQTLPDFEVIMVDDGSPDRCGAMIDEYAARDGRFKAFHKPNGGVSSARQFGIDHATGEYTIHADPDDWVDPEMLEALYGMAKEADADMVICDFYENTYKGQKYIKQEPSSLNHKDVLYDIFGKIHGSTCNKLIRRKLYSEYNIRFPESISFCEDQYVIAAFLKHNIKISYLPKAFYHYVRELNHSSLSRNYNEQTYQNDLLRRKLFDELLYNEAIRQEVYQKNTYSMVSRAFFHGSKYYTSNSFKQNFHNYIDIVKKSTASKTKKILIEASCHGWYQTVFSLLKIAFKIKHHI